MGSFQAHARIHPRPALRDCGPLAALVSGGAASWLRRCGEVSGQLLEVDAARLKLKLDRVGPTGDEAERGQLPAAAAAQLGTERIASVPQHGSLVLRRIRSP